jgi:hypothetical protein
MTQQHAETPRVIYDTLTNDATFMSYVGTRTFRANNTELDAISIVTPGEKLPAIKSINGMEVVIHDISDLSRREYITDDIDIMTKWKVFLLAWDGANGATLNNAARRIMQLFSKAVTIETMPGPSDINAMMQLLVLIPSDSVVLA